jgi:hypothetical protein
MQRELTFASQEEMVPLKGFLGKFSKEYSILFVKMPWPFQEEVRGNGLDCSTSVEHGEPS